MCRASHQRLAPFDDSAEAHVVAISRRVAFVCRLWYRARAGEPPALPGRLSRCNSAGRRSLEEQRVSRFLRPRLPGSALRRRRSRGFYWHFIRQTKGWYVAMFVASLCVALLDTVIPLVIGRLVALMAASDRAAAIASSLPMLMAMGALVLVRAADRDLDRHHDSPERARARRDELDPLAEPLARRASEPHVLPERLRGPDREPRDADRRQLARERDVEHPRGLVHRRLRRHRVCADDLRRLAARRADLGLGDRVTWWACATSCRACASSRARTRKAARP